MTEYELVVRNGTVVAHDHSVIADVGVNDGVVQAVAPGLPPGRVEYDATGLHVIPGLIDVHVHMRDPGWPEKSNFSEGTGAAAAGGVTTVIDMPNTDPPALDAAGLDAKRERLAPQAHVDFGLYGLFGPDNAAGFAELATAGAMGLKLYMARSVVPMPIPSDDQIVVGLELARDADLVVGVHAENERIVQLFTDRVRNAGTQEPSSHSEARPELAEVEAVTRIVTLAQALGTELHLHHLSSGAALRNFQLLRGESRRLTAEAIVPHLCLDRGDYADHGNLIKLNPPVRTSADVEALWAGIADRSIQVVATDHAPHTDAEQTECNVWHAHGGFAGVETLLAVMLSETSRRGLSVNDVARLCSYNPAARWGIPRKGRIAPGFDADMVIVDLDRSTVIDDTSLHGRSHSTPFAGMSVPTIRRTYLRGEIVADDGSLVGAPRGRFVVPDPALRNLGDG